MAAVLDFLNVNDPRGSHSLNSVTPPNHRQPLYSHYIRIQTAGKNCENRKMKEMRHIVAIFGMHAIKFFEFYLYNVTFSDESCDEVSNKNAALCPTTHFSAANYSSLLRNKKTPKSFRYQPIFPVLQGKPAPIVISERHQSVLCFLTDMAIHSVPRHLYPLIAALPQDMSSTSR